MPLYLRLQVHNNNIILSCHYSHLDKFFLSSYICVYKLGQTAGHLETTFNYEINASQIQSFCVDVRCCRGGVTGCQPLHYHQSHEDTECLMLLQLGYKDI